jgi:predicted NBD/HSP70 family sugar kinase
LEGVRNAVLIAVSEGLGTAILAGGQLHSGFNGLAGEFGHIPIDPRGPLCGCGQRGCWEMFASSRAALKTYRKISGNLQVKDVQSLLKLAQDKDPAALKAIKAQATALGRGLRLVTAALSPERILITGEITSCWDTVSPIVQAELQAGMLAGSAPQLTTAGDGYLARLSGSAALLMQRHSRYHRSTHVSRTTKRERRSKA